MRLIFLGPPGSGKGTQAELLAAKLGLAHISTGELFRSEIASDTPLGREVQPLIDAGKLVPDELTLRILRARIAKPDCSKGFILDGFPRTLAQAEDLERAAPPDRVINLDISPETIAERLGSRLTCPHCSAVYNTKTALPKKPSTCDRCGGRLAQRSDETPAVVRERLRVYIHQTTPLIDLYRKKGLLVTVNGEGAPVTVAQRVLEAIQKRS